MELPRDPTIIPQARRYSRTFSAIQGKAFRERDQIVVEIPRIDRTYLTKNVKLYFDFDLSYQEATQTTLQNLFTDLKGTISATSSGARIYAGTFFGYTSTDGTTFTKTSTTNPAYAYTKPIPTFDINGPYGLINRIQVFSYLNNTLLEDVQEHDLLTAQFADFWLQKENIDVNRPYIADTSTNYDYQNPMRKQPCANIFHQGSSVMIEPFVIQSFSATSTTSTIVPSTKSVTLKCELDLFSFLGRFSDKFVPLHNGFKIVFTLSKFTDCIKFNTLYGENTAFYRRFLQGHKATGTDAGTTIPVAASSFNNKLALVNSYDPNGAVEIITISDFNYTPSGLATEIDKWLSLRYSVGTTGNKIVIASAKPFYIDTELTSVPGLSGATYSTDSTFAGSTKLDPTITSASVSNLCIKGDLLEVSPELDSKVDKMVYFQSYKYQKDFFPYEDFSTGSILHDGQREPFTRRILPDLKSITKVYVGQRPVVYPSQEGRQQLGYRIKNYTRGGRLLFNKTEVCNITNDQEAWAALQNSMPMALDPYLNYNDFTLQEESSVGTDGNQMNIATQSLRDMVDKTVAYTSFGTTGSTNLSSWFAGYSGIASNSSGTTYTPYLQLSTLNQGRYLLAFDTRIPGATQNAVAGIDSSKNILEYEIIPQDDVCWKVNIDVFVEHDAFIHVDPGKSTSVTF